MSKVADRVQKHRSNLRKSGLRPVQIWVPDTRRKGFAQECRRQSRMLRNDPHEADVMQWLDKNAARDGWV